MKIFHIAVFTKRSTNVWQAKAFEQLGHQVNRYDYRERYRLLGGPRRNLEIIKKCKKIQPDIILVSKGSGIPEGIIKKCNKIGKTVLWFMDRSLNIDKELRERFGACNYVFCSCRSGVREAKKQNPNTFRLQGGFDPEVHRPIDVPKKRDVCFIGSMYPISRRRMFRKEVGFPVISGVYNLKHSLTISETRINLNFTEGDGVSNRIYKILAAKGFLLSTPWDSLGEEFGIGEDLDIFNTPKELKEKIRYYLEHEEERERIAEHGYKTVQKFDNINYAKKILEVTANAT